MCPQPKACVDDDDEDIENAIRYMPRSAILSCIAQMATIINNVTSDYTDQKASSCQLDFEKCNTSLQAGCKHSLTNSSKNGQQMSLGSAASGQR